MEESVGGRNSMSSKYYAKDIGIVSHLLENAVGPGEFPIEEKAVISMVTHASQNMVSRFINHPHHGDLLALFLKVSLVNTDSIDPIVAALPIPVGLLQGEFTVHAHSECLIIDEDSYVRLEISPRIGDSMIRRHGVDWPCCHPTPNLDGLGVVVVEDLQQPYVIRGVGKSVMLEIASIRTTGSLHDDLPNAVTGEYGRSIDWRTPGSQKDFEYGGLRAIYYGDR